jgi:hypothetical protein
VPILPLIDMLILISTASLFVGFVLKAVDLTTRYHPTVLGFSSLDFVIITGVCLGMALALAARSWVKLNEATLRSVRSHSGLHRRPPVLLVEEEGEAPEQTSTPAEAVRADVR